MSTLTQVLGIDAAKNSQNAANKASTQLGTYDTSLAGLVGPLQTDAATGAENIADNPQAYEASVINNPLNPYNAAYTALAYQPQADASAISANNAVAAARNDVATSGEAGNSSFDLKDQIIRQGEQQEDAANRQNLMYEGGVARYTDAEAQAQAAFARQAGLLGTGIQAGGQLSSNIGGQQQVYQNAANQEGDSLGKLISTGIGIGANYLTGGASGAATAGAGAIGGDPAGSTFGNVTPFSKSMGVSAGDNRTGTNQTGANVQTGMTGNLNIPGTTTRANAGNPLGVNAPSSGTLAPFLSSGQTYYTPPPSIGNV